MKNTYKKLIPFLLLTLGAFVVHAQFTVKGVVKDEAGGETIPGVTVIEKDSLNGTITDYLGEYTITVSSPNDTLVFSYIGYGTKTVPIMGRAIIEVEMTMEQEMLDEVVVIGYGTQKKKVVTGAIATVDSKEIEQIPVLRAEQAMQGRTPGVQVTQRTGQPGEAPTVRIRGTGTTGYAAPLYIVDGVPVANIDYLNPGDIESMDVLKDAASAAIYGSRAANGVVLITTKSGRSGKMNVTFSAYYGIQNPYKQLDMLSATQYRRLMNEGARNAGQTEPFDMSELWYDPARPRGFFHKLAGSNVRA